MIFVVEFQGNPNPATVKGGCSEQGSLFFQSNYCNTMYWILEQLHNGPLHFTDIYGEHMQY